MSILVDANRSLVHFSYLQFIIFQVKRFIRPLFAALILMFAGNAYAVITVGLAIENDLDSNGNITVINGSKVKVTYVVLEDTDKDLNKKDRIELRRVDGDELVSSVLRGKKKSGSVSLKVKNSEDEQLYVRYVRKSGTEIKRISHPDDAGIPLLSIAKANLADLTVGLNAVENPSGAVSVNAAAFKDEFFGNAGCNYILSPVSYGYYQSASGTSCDAMASVTFPDGITLSSISCGAFDSANGSGEEITKVIMRRINLINGVQEDVFQTGATSDSGAVQTISDDTPGAGTEVVDNGTYSYILWTDFGSGAPVGSTVRFYGCTFRY